MTKEKIVEILETIEQGLDDANNCLPDYNSNSDTQVYIDSALSDIYNLKQDIEESISDENQEVTLDEVMNTSPTLAKLL